MTTTTFAKDNFPSLSFVDYVSPYTPIGVDDLAPDERSLMLLFLSFVTEIDDIDLSHILLVKAAEGGILKEVYGPSLFKREATLVLKVGGLEFPVGQDKSELRLGQLVGTLSFESEPVKIKVKNDDGEEFDFDLYNATCDFMPLDGTELEFRVRCSWNPLKNPQPGVIKATMRRGESITDFFREVPGEGGTILKMQDLGEGEFKVSGIRKFTGGEYGDSYVLDLTDGQSVWARNNVLDVLKSGWKMPADKPVTLLIANIQQRKEGKYSLDCALKLREPRDPNQPKLAAAKKPNVSVINGTAPVGAKQLVASASGTFKPAGDNTDPDDIPF